MLKKIFILALCFSLLIGNTAMAYDAGKPDVSAMSAAVLDFHTKDVLYNKDMFARRPVASTTKIMTCLIACESGKLNGLVTITPEMLYGAEGTLIYLKAGDKISLLDLVKGALISSGNDAAQAIAFALAGSNERFAALMNERAQALDMKNTHFVTPSGLDKKGHFSCAYDMALLTREALKNCVFRTIVSRKFVTISINGKSVTLYNHNKLLSRDASFAGVKTGFTKKAGRCLVSAYKYKDAYIICVTLNDPDDWDDHLALVNFAKKSYNIKSGKRKVKISLADSVDTKLDCVASYELVTCGDDENISVRLFYYPFIYKPYKSGDIAGYAKICVKDECIKTVKIKIV